MKKLYLAAPGVTQINGVRVPSNRRMSLTEAEALYDLGHGRLTPAPVRKQARPKAPK